MNSPEEARYLVLMDQFAEGRIGAADFVSKFFSLWKEAIRRQDALRASWGRRLDIELISQLQRGEISKSDFSEKWRRLWALDELAAAFQDIVSQIFSACDMLGYPDPKLAVTETQLHELVVRLADEYRLLKNRSGTEEGDVRPN